MRGKRVAFSADEVELLLGIARDATVGHTFRERVDALSESLGLLVPNSSMTAFVIDPAREQTPKVEHLLFKNRDIEHLTEYAKNYLPLDPMGHKFTEGRGRIYAVSDFVSPRKFGKDAFTGEFMPKFDVRYIVGFSHRMPNGLMFAYALHRDRALGDFSSRERELLQLASPDFGRAAFGAILDERVTDLARQAPADDGTAGAILFDASGDVAHADASAVNLVRTLRDEEALRSDELIALVRRLVALVQTGCKETPVLERIFQRPGGAVRLRLSPVVRAEATFVLAVLDVVRPGTADHFAATCAQFGLTPREREVVALAIRGLGNRQIAQQLGISPVTVGIHLSKIYDRTRTEGRHELTTLFLGGPAGAIPPPHQA